MAEVIVSVAAKVVEYLVKPTIHQGQCLFCTNKIIKNLEKTKEELTLQRDEIQISIEQAKNRTEIIEIHVERWLSDVSNQLEEIDKLKLETESNNCCQGWCPTWRRYQLCKQLVKKTKLITDLKKNSKFEPFSRLAMLPDIEYNSSENFTYFESTKLAYNQLLESLRDNSTYVVGLYGMGGSGKTTLVTEVGKKAKELNLFDKVVMVNVSQTPDIIGIQKYMADMLNLKLEEESEETRARRLWMRLKDEKRVLLIVDDVWRKFDLKLVGIDFNGNHKGSCKVLLTTRRQQVCSIMDCKRKIRMELLSEEEAWNLFQKYAGIDDQSSDNILNMGREVARECKGLPIAIKAVGSSLKGKLKEFQVDEWKIALQKLKCSKPIDVEEGERDAFSCLKLSYDYLRNKEAELLFFMCAMFPKDHIIPIEDLIRYGVGLGICGEFELFDSARSLLRVGLNKLVDSCLLTYSAEWKEHVKMHDMVRDLALWIASREDRAIMVTLENDLSSLSGETAIKDCFAVSSWCQETDHISEHLDAPKLEILVLNTRNSLDLSNVSFEGMEGLKVMAIINEGYINKLPLLLPQSIDSLTSLRTLRLVGWKLGDISSIVNLKRLEILDLRHSHIKEVSNGIEKMSKLKLLDLTDCDVVENYNCEAIGRCSGLEELYISGYLNDSEYLLQYCAHYATLPNIRRYKLKLSSMFEFEYLAQDNSTERVLRLNGINDSTMFGSCKNIIPDIDQELGGTNDLTDLYLVSCFQIEYLIDTTSDPAGSFQVNSLLDKLIKLELEGMKNLKELCRGACPLGFFKRLEELHITRCQQLHSIFPLQCELQNLRILHIYRTRGFDSDKNCTAPVLFSMSIARSLQQLEELTIEECPKLRHIITQRREFGSETGQEISAALNNSHLMFPKLNKFSISNCPKLEFVLPISYIYQGPLQLQEIKIDNACEMKYIFGQCDSEYNSSHHTQLQVTLPRLQVFELNNLRNLLEICPQNYHSCWPSLRELSWSSCPKLTTPWTGMELRQQQLNTEVVPDDDRQDHRMTSKLQRLTLKDLPEIRLIWLDPTPTQILSFKYLQHLVVDGFKELKSVFSMVILRSLPELAFLSICNCEELLEIIVENEESHNSHVEMFLPKLSQLQIEQCNKLKSLFSISMIKMLSGLSTLCISEAAQLEEVFRHGEDKFVDEKEIMLSNLREIQLERLPSFVDILQGLMFHKLKLQKLIIDGCPKFAPMLGATQVIPLHCRTEEKLILWEIATTFNQLCRQEKLPAAMQALLNIEFFTLKNCRAEGIIQLQVEGGFLGNTAHKSFNSKLRSLHLLDLLELRFIWSASTFLGFHKLERVEVKGCPKLKTIFPPGIVGSLQNLKWLIISDCEELEEIMPSDFELCFQELHMIEVKNCNKLKCLFPDSMACNFPKVDSLRVEECSEIERIFGLKRIEANPGERLVLRELIELILRSLPNFIEIGKGLKLQEQSYVCVVDCPNYIST